MTQRRPDLGAILLAGGGSRRMGRPKALLQWHGTPLVVRVAGLLGRVAGAVVIVGAPGEPLPHLQGAITAVDAHAGRGPLEGIAAGLRALPEVCEAVFVAATDQPLLHPGFVRDVVAALTGFEAAVPVSEGVMHPLTAAYRPAVLARAERLLSGGELRATSLVEGASTQPLDAGRLAHPESLWNVNTPEDYERLLGLPEPSVLVDGDAFRAATVGRLLDMLRGRLPDHPALLLDGERVDHRPHLPLAEGDEIVTGGGG